MTDLKGSTIGFGAFLLLIVAGLWATPASAQSTSPTVIGSAGGSATAGDGVTIMWTLGELAITTVRGENTTLTQGFHQPPPGTTDVPTLRIVADALELSPNPTTGLVRIDLPRLAPDSRLIVLDLLGRPLIERELGPGSAGLAVDLAGLSSGTYMVRITTSDSIYEAMVTLRL